MKITHTITAQPHVHFRVTGLEDMESAYPMIEIEFSYHPGSASYIPRGEYAPIDPPDPAEVEMISAKLIDGDGLDPPQDRVNEWASDWLQGEGYDAACALAEANSGPDPDERRERARDDRP